MSKTQPGQGGVSGVVWNLLHSPMQANYLRQLNQKGDPEAVIRQFEGGRINSTEATLGEYVKALVKVDRLDSTALAQTLQVPLRLPHLQATVFCQRVFYRVPPDV